MMSFDDGNPCAAARRAKAVATIAALPLAALVYSWRWTGVRTPSP